MKQHANIGSRIRARRAELGAPITRFAREAGFSRSYLYEVEEGRKTLSPAALEKVARCLQTSIEYLSGETDDPGPIAVEERQLSTDEHEVLLIYRSLKPTDRRTARRMLEGLAAATNEPDAVQLLAAETLQTYEAAPGVKRRKKPSQPVQLVRLAIAAAAGSPLNAEEHWLDDIEVPSDLVPTKGKAVIVRAQGDSMIDININDGDLLLCYAVAGSFNYHRGDVVVAQCGDSDFTIKRYVRQHKGNVYLAPENASMEMQVHPRESCSIAAVVVARRDNGKWYPVPRRDTF